MPDPLQSASPSSAGAPPSSPSSPPPQSSGPPPSPSSPPPSPSSSSGGVATPSPGAQAPTPQEPSFRDMARQYGFDVSSAPDDRSAWQNILQNYQQAQQYAQLGQNLAPHYSEFQSWLQQKQQSQRPAQTEEKPWYSKWWTPPQEYDPAIERMVTTDANGRLVAVEGAPPDTLSKYHSYKQFRQKEADKFLQNPYAYFEEPIKTLASQEAQKIVQEHLNQFRDQSFAQQFTQQHSDWLYQRDQQGQILTKPEFNVQTGQMQQTRVLSPWGERFRDYVLYAQNSLNIGDERARAEYAQAMIQRDYYAQQSQTPPAQQSQQNQQTPRQQANQTFLQNFAPAPGAGRQPSQGGSLPAPMPNGNPLSQNAKLSLAERMRNNFRTSGVNDQNLNL